MVPRRTAQTPRIDRPDAGHSPHPSRHACHETPPSTKSGVGTRQGIKEAACGYPTRRATRKRGECQSRLVRLSMHLQTTKGFAMQIGAAEGGGRGKGGLGAAEYEAAGALACVTGTHAWRLRIGESHARTPPTTPPHVRHTEL